MKFNHFKENKENSISFYSRTPLKKTSEALAHLDVSHSPNQKSNKEKTHIIKHKHRHIVGWGLKTHTHKFALHYIRSSYTEEKHKKGELQRKRYKVLTLAFLIIDK